MTTTATHYAAVVDSPVDELTIVATDVGLRAILWDADKASRVPLPEATDDAGIARPS